MYMYNCRIPRHSYSKSCAWACTRPSQKSTMQNSKKSAPTWLALLSCGALRHQIIQSGLTPHFGTTEIKSRDIYDKILFPKSIEFAPQTMAPNDRRPFCPLWVPPNLEHPGGWMVALQGNEAEMKKTVKIADMPAKKKKHKKLPKLKTSRNNSKRLTCISKRSAFKMFKNVETEMWFWKIWQNKEKTSTNGGMSGE